MTAQPKPDALGQAERDVSAARVRLSSTVNEIQARLAPSQLLDEAISGVKERSSDLAESAGEVVRDRPGAVAAGAVGVAMLLARKPIVRLAQRIFSRR